MFSFNTLKVSQRRLSFINKRLYSTTKPPVPPKQQSSIKQLIAKYGYTSLVTYLFVGGIDFALSYMLIHQVGEEEINVKYNELKKALGFKSKNAEEIRKEFELKRQTQNTEETNKEKENTDLSILGKIKHYGNILLSNTMFKEVIIAYGLHKSLIFIRLPVTAMITPPVYNYLLKVKPNWVLRPQAFTKTVINPMAKNAVNQKKNNVSWWRKIIG